MADTPAPNLLHDPPSLPNSPEHKRTRKIEPSHGLIGTIPERTSTPTPQSSTMEVPATSSASSSQSVPLQVKFLSETARAPTRGSAFAAGYDLYAAENTQVPARGQTMVDTGISIAVPEGTYGRIAPRSGLAAKHSIDTGAGVIDYDYRGPVKVILFNFSDTPFSISTGDRIAQLVLERIVTPEVSVVQELKETARGGGGFGSTGGFGDAVKSVAHVTAAV